MLHLAIQSARHRFSALLAVAFAVLGGVALVTGTAVIAETGLRSHLPAGRLAGADVVIAPNQVYRQSQDLPLALPERATLPADLVERLGTIPGVLAAVGDVSFPAALLDARGEVVPGADARTAGHGWSSAELRRPSHVQLEGTKPQNQDEIAVDADLAAAAGVRLGERVQVIVAGRAGSYRLTGVLQRPGGSDPGVFLADRTATELAGRASGPKSGTVDLIGLRTEPGTTEAVAAAVHQQLAGTPASTATVATGADRGDTVAPDTTAAGSLLVLLASSLAGVILLIVGFVVAGALTVSVNGQRRELALLRAVGATPGQIRHLAAAQATVVAGLAMIPAVPLGYLLAEHFRRMLADLGLISPALPLAISPVPALAAVLLALLVVQVSARGAAWRTSRMPATEAVAESRSEPRVPSRLRARAGLLVIVAATVLSIAPLLARTQIGAATTSIAGILAAIGLALAGPALVHRVSATLVRRLPVRASAPTWLAVSNLHGYALRFAGSITTLAMAVVFVLTYALAQTTVMTAGSKDVSAGTLAGHRITAAAIGGLPDGVLDEVRAAAGVRAAAAVGSTTVLWPYQFLGEDEIETHPALILDPAGAGVLDLDVRSGRLSELTGATVAIGSDVARSRKAALGEQVELVLGDGTEVQARVVAIYARSLGFGPVVLSADLAAGHAGSGLDQSILVRTNGTAAATTGLDAVVSARPGLSLEPYGASAGISRDAVPAEAWINLAAILVLLGYLLLGIANKLVAATSQRRTEIAMLQLIGATPGQVRAMMRNEAALIGAGAVSTGLLLAAVPLALLGLGFLDRPWPAGPLWLLPVTVLTVLGIAFVTVEFPTRQALRTNPVQALARPT